nr:MAG TPA: hypothetical protein [Bacteriophage sp.]
MYDFLKLLFLYSFFFFKSITKRTFLYIFTF